MKASYRWSSLFGISVFGIILSLIFLRSGFIFASDFSFWKYDAVNSARCFTELAFPCPSISRFPFAYYLNSILVSTAASLRGEYLRIVAANFAFLILPFLVMRLQRTETQGLKPFIYCVFIVLTPLLPGYVPTATIEIQAGISLGLFFAAIATLSHEQDRATVWPLRCVVFLCGAMQPLYKDFNGILIMSLYALIYGLQIGFRKQSQLAVLHHIPVPDRFGIGGLVFGQTIAVCFNLLRYDSPFPILYMKLAREAAIDYQLSLEFFIYEILSPNGGLIWFWGISFIVLFYLIRRMNLSVDRAAILFPLSYVFIYAVILSQWHSPFGWTAWGNRLILPSVLAFATVLIMTLQVGARTQDPADRLPALAQRFKLFKITLAVSGFLVASVSGYYIIVSYSFPLDQLLHLSVESETKHCKDGMGPDFADQNLDFRTIVTEQALACGRERFWHIVP